MSLGLNRHKIAGFLGENRLLPDALLKDNIAVDGRNVDYQRGTIKKRKGFVKTHATSVKTGGVLVDNSASNNKCVLIRHSTALQLSGDFTIEFVIEPMMAASSITTTSFIVNKRSGTNGWFVWYNVTSQIWRFSMYDSGGTLKTVSVNGDCGTGDYRINERYHIAARRTGTTIDLRVTRMSDGTALSSGGTTCSGITANTYDVLIGCLNGITPAAQISSFKYDELRIWSDYRTDAELDAAKYRELSATELLDTNLIGYWPLNDESSTIVEDKSINKNHGHLNAAGPSFVEGLVPTGTDENYALRGDGYDDYAEGVYNSAYAPILNTSNQWTVELWARLDSSITPSAVQTLLSLGNYASTGAGQRGAVFSIEMTTAGLLQYRHSSTTTDQNTVRTLTTPYTFTPGVPVHIALQRNSSQIILFINGVAWDTNTVTTENGPSTSTSYGMEFLCINTGGTRSQFAQFTIDEVRLWAGVRNRPQIQAWYDRELADAETTYLVGYWRFNAEDKEKDETGNIANLTTGPTADCPVYSNGLVSNREPKRNILMLAPMARTIRTDEVNSGKVLFDRENIICTKHAMFTQAKTNMRFLRNLDVPGSSNLYSWCNYNGFLIFCNGVGRNYAYNGRNLPSALTFPTFPLQNTTMTVSAASGTFPTTGVYYYKYSWYDENRGIEGEPNSYNGLIGYSFATITAVTQQVAITGLPSTYPTGYPEVTHIRIYRLDPGAQYFRYVSAVAIGTTSYTDTGVSTTFSASLTYTKTDLSAMNVCATHANRLFMARGSDIYFSEAGSMDFQTTSTFGVDSEDGDSITGLKAGFGGLVVFKKNSIHFLDGDGPSTFAIRKIVDGIGCVSQNTIASGVNGMYFLAADGVYLFNGNGAKYISHSQQPLFARIDHTKSHQACGGYLPETHQYVVSLDLVEQSSTGSSNADDSTKLPAAAYDSADYQSLFTHFYKCDTTLADAVGTGGTLTTEITASNSDTQRGLVALHTPTSDGFRGTITSQTAVSSNWTVGFWRKFPNAQEGTSISDYPFMSLLRTSGTPTKSIEFRVDNGTTYGFGLGQSNSVMMIAIDDGIVFRYVVNATDWYHICLKKSGTTYTVYINGEAVGSFSGSNPAGVFTHVGAIFSAGIGGDQPVDCYLDNIFWVRDTALTSEQILGIYNYERAGPAVSVVDAPEEESVESLTMAYDEETDSWARWDKRFSAMSLAEYTQRTNELLAGYNGYVVRLFDGNTDAYNCDGVTGAFTKSGALTAAQGSSITDSSATFPTSGNGLNGVEVVCVPSDTSLAIQTKRILYNTATVLYLDSDLDTITGTYYIGAIDMIWTSRWMDLGDDQIVKVLYFILAWVIEASNTVTFRYKSEYSETWVVTTFTDTDELVRFVARHRGRKFKFQLEHIPEGDLDIEQLAVEFGVRGAVY